MLRTGQRCQLLTVRHGRAPAGLFACALGSLIAFHCSAGPGPQAERPEVALGQRFSYSGKVMGVACADWTVVAIESNGDVVSSCGDYRMRFSGGNDLNPVRMYDRNERTLAEFVPHAPLARYPLSVGHKWSGQYRFVSPDFSINANVRTTCAVEAFEPVTVPAGTLEAFRIACVDRMEIGGRDWRTHTTRWYAPEAATFVKAEQREDPANWNYELTAYTLSNPDSGPETRASETAFEPPSPASAPMTAPPTEADWQRTAPILDPTEY